MPREYALIAKERLARPLPAAAQKCATECEHKLRPLWARGRCKACYDKWLKQTNPKYYAAQKANTRGWAKRNPEKARQYAHKHRHKDPTFSRKKTLARYGMTPEDYARLLLAQNNGCAICGKPPGKKALHIDHSHRTGKVRGLLCFRCNYGLSFFSENSDTLLRASQYVKRSGR